MAYLLHLQYRYAMKALHTISSPSLTSLTQAHTVIALDRDASDFCPFGFPTFIIIFLSISSIYLPHFLAQRPPHETLESVWEWGHKMDWGTSKFLIHSNHSCSYPGSPKGAMTGKLVERGGGVGLQEAYLTLLLRDAFPLGEQSSTHEAVVVGIEEERIKKKKKHRGGSCSIFFNYASRWGRGESVPHCHQWCMEHAVATPCQVSHPHTSLPSLLLTSRWASDQNSIEN